MSTIVVSHLAVISASAASPPETPPGHAQATHVAWGSCQIHLVADRVTSLRAGSTHKVYRGWRFAVAMRQGQPQPGTILFTVPVDPALQAKGQTRYALLQLANQGAIDVGEAAAFSWSVASTGTTDPFAVALAQARQELDAAGWRQDVATPTRYAKTDPTTRPREEPATATSDSADNVALSGAATAPPTAGSDHLALATPLYRAMTGLDEWETDGGRRRDRPVIGDVIRMERSKDTTVTDWTKEIDEFLADAARSRHQSAAAPGGASAARRPPSSPEPSSPPSSNSKPTWNGRGAIAASTSSTSPGPECS